VLPVAEPVAVLDAAGRAVTVDERWTFSAAPAGVRWSSVPGTEVAVREARIASWAGPWPLVERWWAPDGRARAHVQAVFDDGGAVLLAWCAGAWTCEARYD
jgi:protein ImuB